ncbi:MAG TPA: hypothetical protein VL738_09645 [Dactylosporangium sp.]|jgi:hypothetical protein|nr:hypothetical protein [Dactylosporangium sp.]
MRQGGPGGPVQTLSMVALLLAVLMFTSGCFVTPSLIVFSPLIAIGAALFYIAVGVIRLSKFAYNMTWSDLGRMLRQAAVAVGGVPALVVRMSRRVAQAGFSGAFRAAGLVLLAVVGIAVGVPLIYAIAVVLLVLVEIPIWIALLIALIVSKGSPAVTRVISAMVPSLARRILRTGDEDKRHDGIDAQFINFWIPELQGRPDEPLVAEQQYLGMLQVGALRSDNVATGDTAIPRDDIPDQGLDSEWILWSTTVRLTRGDDPSVEFDVAEAGADTQWMARFSLHIPHKGESEDRNLVLTPLAEGEARIDGLVRVRGDAYREFTVRLRVAGSPTEDDEETVVATELLVVPARDLAPKPGHEWQRSSNRLRILFLGSMAQLQSEELGPDEAESWRPDIAVIESIIDRARDAADAFRSRYHQELDDITVEALAQRLEGFRPMEHWDRAGSTPADGAEQRWEGMARSQELARLAYEGNALYRAIFPGDSRLAEVIGLLEPGDRLDLTWQQNGGSWVSHVPWTLLYAAEPPLPGEPVDANEFFGLRYRIAYRAYSMGVRSRGIVNGATRAHLMYWGGREGDETWAASREHAEGLARWQPLVLPTETPGKAELQRFLRDPAPHPVGLLYFYCQCNTGDGSDPVLRFGSTNGPDDTLGLMDLGTRQLPDQPLVFANACDTVSGEPYTPNRLERLFFDRKCRAFIGTECKVPIRFAARFADVFFTFLYDPAYAPIPAGEALVQARRYFWTEYRNIGGLFYSYVNDYHVSYEAARRR